MSSNQVGIIVQARMGSSRLPGKVLKPIMGVPMLTYLLERLRRCTEVDKIIVATTVEPQDDMLASFIEKQEGVHCYRGSEEDVLSRYYESAQKYSLDIVVRITADCPLISPQVIDEAIKCYKNIPSPIRYVSNIHKRSYPRGLDTEVFSYQLLQQTFENARDMTEREHVTPFIWRQPHKFDLVDIVSEVDNSHLRWTVDTKEDFELVERIYEVLYPEKLDFTYEDILSLIQRQPDLTEINQNAEQKHL